MKIIGPLPSFWLEQQSGTEWWIVRKGGIIRVEIDGIMHEVGIPDGYRHNRASIPDGVEWIVSKDDCGTEAPPPHDGMYGTNGDLAVSPPAETGRGQNVFTQAFPWCWPAHHFTRTEADEMFYQVMKMDTGKTFKAKLAWLALRLFGRKW